MKNQYRCHKYLDFKINLDKLRFIQRLINEELIILYLLKKETNGKLHSKQGMVILNTMSCLLKL